MADLKGSPRVLRAQVQIEAVLEGQSTVIAGHRVSTPVYMQHLRSATALLLYAAIPEDLGELPEVAFTAMRSYCQERDACLQARQQLRSDGNRGGPQLLAYRGLQRSAALMMAVLPTAVEWLNSASVSELADRMLPMTERTRNLKSVSIRQIGKDFSFGSLLAEALNVALSPRSAFDRRIGSLSRYTQKHGTPYSFTADKVPQLFWMPDFQQTFKPLIRESHMGDDYARRGISMALVKLCGPFSWAEAAAALGLPASSARGSATTLMGVINSLGRNEGFALALHQKATELSAITDRTDYAALRKQFYAFTEIDYNVWSDLAQLAGVLPGKRHGKNRFAAAWVWARITGGDFRLSPALTGTQCPQLRQRDQYLRFLRNDFARLAPALETFAVSLIQTSTP